MTTSGTTPLRILVLGGTSWLGGATAANAHARGHQVTCLARGESGSVPEGPRHVRGDRTQPGAYDEVAGPDTEPWDAVIDVTRQPEQVRSALDALADRAAHWIFVSTCSVYADHSTPGADEDAALLEPWSGTGEAGEEDYGPAKVACETACREGVAPEALLIARSGLIVGRGDTSDRFGYWPARLSEIGSPEEVVLVPPLETPVQVVDVLDLASWLVDVAERRTAGILDVVGERIAFDDVIGACAEVTGSEPVLAEPDEEWLLEKGVTPWAGPDSLPLWLPSGEYAGLAARDGARARAAGLTARPLRESVLDALAWEKELGLARERHAGLSVDLENALLSELLEA